MEICQIEGNANCHLSFDVRSIKPSQLPGADLCEIALFGRQHHINQLIEIIRRPVEGFYYELNGGNFPVKKNMNIYGLHGSHNGTFYSGAEYIPAMKE